MLLLIMNKFINTNKFGVLKRGFMGSCPKCGKTKLFKSYLKQVDICKVCETEWINVRADDAPAWASMLISGHFIAPFFYLIAFKLDLPDWIRTLVLIVIGVIICLFVLPRVKGFFIALIWATDAPTAYYLTSAVVSVISLYSSRPT